MLNDEKYFIHTKYDVNTIPLVIVNINFKLSYFIQGDQMYKEPLFKPIIFQRSIQCQC